MATGWRSIRTFAITTAIALIATAASGQSAQPGAAGPLHDDTWHHANQTSHRSDSIAANLKFGMTRAATIDADLKVLVDDMNMFTGEMKVNVMARILTLLVERLSIMREQAMAMDELMMRGPMHPSGGASEKRPSTEPDMAEAEAGEMCREVPF
jgi:hypothetical protein